MNYFECFNDSPENLYDCRENCRMQYYENVTDKDFAGFSSDLNADGYHILQKNSVDGNSFLMAEKNGRLFTAYFTPYDSSLRVTSQADYSIPVLSEQKTERKCGTAFYCFENDHSLIDCGMCLLIQCCDYSFFIVDSGHYFQHNDNDRIHKFMRERTPEGQKIVVSGWAITHAHTDHICKLIDFLKYNCDDVIIEGFYSNLLSFDYYTDDWGYEEKLIAGKLFGILEKHKAPKYKLHSGMRFFVRNLKITVLGTHEDIYPDKITDYNDSSCILMVESESTKIFIPGDAAVKASKMLEKRYSDFLECDIVQVSHHGHTGLSSSLYKKLNAKAAVFPVTRIKFDEEFEKQEANRTVVELADEYYISSDGTIKIELPYSEGSVSRLKDESFEDFQKIKRLWGYDYTPERKQELYDLFIKNGGSLDDFTFPVNNEGFMEITPWLTFLK